MLFLKNLYQNLPSPFLVSRSLLLLGLINIISLILLLFLSPIYGVCWLVAATFYFLFKGNYKNIFVVWGLFFGTWYFFFILFFSDYESSILIGSDHTLKVLVYLCDKYSIHNASWCIKPFEGFCFQTVIILDSLSVKLGFSIYIPSLLAGLKSFIPFLKSMLGGEGKGSAECAGEENLKKKEGSTNESPSFLGGFFKGSTAPKPEPKREDYPDLDACAGFKNELDKAWKFSLVKSKEGVSGIRYVYYKELLIPFYGKFTGCVSRDASKLEIKYSKDS